MAEGRPMDPFLLLGVLAIVIGVVGVVVLFLGKKKRKSAPPRTHD
jgi:hypothetical protein